MWRAALLPFAVLGTATLCRFTVRDVGFVDLGDPGYRYFAYVSEADTPGLADRCREAAAAVFAETNVAFEVVDLAGDPEQAGRRYLQQLGLGDRPTTVLVHPDGRAVEVPFDGPFADGGARVFEAVAASRLRARLTEAVLRHYCVVLLVEGDDGARNRRVAAAVDQACLAIRQVFDKMPKDVGELPLVIRLTRAEQPGERLLLWSLEATATAGEPVVTVLTGRGRRFGPTLRGAAIDRAAVLDVLAKVGESCECGLDRSWMRGTRIPLRWDAATRQLAADRLGFDPENPLVKSEISSLLARGRNGAVVPGAKEPSVADLLLGYSETSILAADETPDGPGATAGGAAGGVDAAAPAAPADGRAVDADTGSVWQVLGFAALGLAVVSLLVAGWIAVRSSPGAR